MSAFDPKWTLLSHLNVTCCIIGNGVEWHVMTLVNSEENHVALLMKKVASARAGDCKDAIAAAMLIHKFPSIARRTGLNTEYEFFLNFGMRSKNPEVLVAAGDALLQGKKLARNIRLGMRYFGLANKLSPFMGAYMIGRLDVLQDRPIAGRMLRKGAKAGHIPSLFLFEKFRYRKSKRYLSIFSLPILIFLSIKCGLILTYALRDTENLYMRFWRYQDTGIAKNKDVLRALPKDRAMPFYDIEEALSE
jgi:hypothetical protein